MRKTDIFYINDEKLELPLFQKGDRVKPIEHDTLAIGAEGTVESTRFGGLFVEVIWDKEFYYDKNGGKVDLGSERMVNHLILINED